jgi:hypothetical protein
VGDARPWAAFDPLQASRTLLYFGGIAMNKSVRWMGALAFVAMIAVVNSRQVAAQGFNLDSIKKQVENQQQNNKSNQNKNDDDNDDDNNSNSQGNRRSKSGNQSNNQNGQQFQQFFPGGQNSQGQNNQGQNNANQFHRSNQQGNNSNNGQFQNWQQNNQNSLKIGNWNSGKWQGTHDVKKWTQTFSGNQQPFSSKWYKDHPKAWKCDNNNVNFWVGGSLPGVYSWLGWGNVPQQYRRYYGNVPQYERAHYGEWYPLGVFSLMSSPGDPGTRIVQLAVDEHGHISGNYYDMITSANYSLSGDIHQQSQQVNWWLNKNQFVRFRANIYELLQPYGMLTVQLPGGEQQWQFVRLEN